MATLVDKESYWANFYMKRSKELFLKMKGVAKELEHFMLTLNSILSEAMTNF